MFKFITRKPLWLNMLFAFIFVFVILFIFLLSLNFITGHGKTLSIPSITGKSFAEARSILEQQGFEVQLQDSIYIDTAAPLAVLRQFPEADAVVKKNRTVYLTINRAVPPTVDMPNLEGMSFRNAEIVLRQYGLTWDDTIYKPDYAKNSVLEQQYNGERIKPGTKIAMGSSVVLVLGSGVGQDEFSVPDLFGLPFSQGRVLLESNGLTLGAVVARPDVRDTANAYIYDQRPLRLREDGRVNRIRQGQSIDLFLQNERPERKVDSTQQAQNPY